MPTVLGEASGASVSGDINLATPAGMQVDDTVVVIQCNDYYTLANLTTPTSSGVGSWSLQHSYDGGTNSDHAKVWMGVATAAGAQTVTVSGTDEERYAQMVVLPGAVFDVAASSAVISTASFVAPSVTATGADDVLIVTVGANYLSGSPTYSFPGGMTAYTHQSAGGVTTYRSGSEQLSAAGATGTRTVTASGSATGFVVTVAIKAAEPPPPGPLQPSLVADRGTAANATAGTTTALTLTSPTAIAVGNYLVARVAVDNSGGSGAAPGCTVTDPRSNTWTVLGPALADPGAASAGSTAYLCYARVDTAYQAADVLTFNWGGVSTTAKAVVVEEWANIHRVTPAVGAAVTNNSVAAASTTAVTTGSISATTPNQLVYASLATEGIAADTVGADADTTNGTWATLTTVASANATATNNQRVSGQYKLVTAAGAQTWDSTITSRDWAVIAAVFAVDEHLPQVSVRPGLAAIQGSVW